MIIIESMTSQDKLFRIDENGYLPQVTQIESPNYDLRTPKQTISLIVIHCISLPAGHFGGDFIRELFCNQIDHARHTDFDSLRGMRVSSHLLIRRTGQIQQFVPFHQRAWHAGQSSFDGRNNCNDFSLGIELEGTDTGQFNDIQYARLGETCRCLAEAYAIPVKNIVGHSDIAPGRKTDPGVGFDWARLHRLMAG